MTLPETLKATDIKWLSVWCRAFQVNFGDLSFPEDLSFEDNSLDSAVLTGSSDDHEDEESADAEGDKLDDLPPPLLGKFIWYFVTKIVLAYREKKKYFSDREKLLKFEAESQEFSKFLRSLEQFIQTVKGQNNFWQQNAFLTVPGGF